MDPRNHVDHIALALGWAALAVFVFLLYLILAPFLIPLGWAAVFAIVSYPLHVRLVRRCGDAWAAALTTLGIGVVLIVPALVVLSAFIGEAVDVASAVQRAAAEGRFGWIEREWQKLLPAGSSGAPDIGALVTEAARRGSTFLLDRSGLVLRDIALFPIKLGIALFATFFLLRDAAAVTASVRRLLPMPALAREALIQRTIELVTIGITSSLAVAAVQGLLGGAVFWLVGIEAPVFWGVIMGAFCLLPFGAWAIWLPAAAILAGSGEVGRGLVVLALGLTLVSAADNVLRPMLMSGRAHVHGLVILIGLLGGISVFGSLGLVLGPILVATGLALMTAYVEAPAHDVWRV